MLEKFSEPRAGKKLLVLDIDCTLGDLGTGKFEFVTHVRPHLHEFLTRAYQYYDIVLWSAVDMGSLTTKMKQMKVLQAKNFRFLCCLDETAMTVRATTKFKEYRTKALSVIWSEYPQYNKTNSLICDDQKANYITNLSNGINIKPYKHTDYLTDDELRKLALYVEHLAKNSDDFSQENHWAWHDFTY